jgi:abortive infection bacteriophage resistance protein
MSKIPYAKPPITYQEQLNLLKQRGLIIPKEVKALHLLENISYYRLSGYWFPLLADKKAHIFKPNSSFDAAFNLYCFDRELRQLVLAEIEKIEVAVRAKMSYILSTKDNNPFWFQDASIFSNPVKHANSLTKIGEEFARSDEEFIKSFREKYSNATPPSWITLEITSFGTLSLLFKNLKPGKEKRDIANYFGLADTVFETWIHSLVYLRNVCAHHTRLWNRAMSIQPQKQWLTNKTIPNNRTYFILSMVSYLLQTINPNHQFINRFLALLAKYPNVDPKALGFPNGWEAEPLWQNK